MYLMSAAWGSLAIVLSLLGAGVGWLTWRSQGRRGLVLGAGLVLLPLGMWLTGTLRLAGFLVDWFAGWATGLVLSPSVILGTVMLVGGVALLAAGSRMAARRSVAGSSTTALPTQGRSPARRGAQPAAGDDDLADIEALLRRNGIS